MKEQRLSINDNAFEKMKLDFDIVLQEVISVMQEKSVSESEVTLKLKITLCEQYAPDHENSGDNALRLVVSPKFEYKISSVVQLKSSLGGTTPGNYELMWDEVDRSYKLVFVDDGQTSMFDDGTAI